MPGLTPVKKQRPGSLFTMIVEREADARATIEELRAGIDKLTEQLTTAETPSPA